MQTTGKATNISNSGSEGRLKDSSSFYQVDLVVAMQALLQSIAPELKTESMSPHTLQKLSSRITDLLGEDAAQQLLNGHSDQQVI